MNILIACEESQRVCVEFRKKGHCAFSCDIQECSGGYPEWHIQSNVLPLLNGDCEFITSDGKPHFIKSKWDMIIAHPPCTFLTVTGNRWFNEVKYGEKAKLRKEKRKNAFDFFMKFIEADCDKICIENPIGYVNSRYRKPDQIIQPYFFGDAERKSTCLWLKNLPLLKTTKLVKPIIIKHKNGKTDPLWHYSSIGLSSDERSKIRSKTFFGIARAMAEQWG